MSRTASLDRQIEIAARREENDDHLTTEERRQLVEAYASEHPEFERTVDLDEDFVSIIF